MLTINRTRFLFDDSFVPMMVTRIILSLKKAASILPTYEMPEVPTGSLVIPREFHELQETRGSLGYNQGDGVSLRVVEHIHSFSDLDSA
jgi:hypothetical protein